jgi:hypothetical protein
MLLEMVTNEQAHYKWKKYICVCVCVWVGADINFILVYSFFAKPFKDKN